MRKSLAVLALLLAAGCSSAGADGGGAPATASQPPPPSKLGVAQPQLDGDGVAVRATAIALRLPLKSAYPPDRKGYVYAGVDAKVCVDKVPAETAVTMSWAPWSLAYEDGTVVEPVSSWSPDWYKVPLYPAAGRRVKVGSCVRGWILFEVPRGSKPDKVAYSPNGPDGEPVEPLEWSLG